jgi:hypothetical protein
LGEVFVCLPNLTSVLDSSTIKSTKQGELERGNAAELRACRGALITLLSQDALTPAARGGTGQAVALHLMAALVAADAGGAAMAAEVHSKGVARALLDGLARYGAQVVRQFSHKAQVGDGRVAGGWDAAVPKNGGLDSLC